MASPRIVRPDAFVTMPWKNGGGVTHEIARRDIGGQLAWRLSLAEVARDGPYSTFSGMERILTVVGGNGTRLRDTERGTELVALPDRPVRFSGEASIAGVLLDGPCRNFNLIYDPALVSADVALAAGPARLTLSGVGDGDQAVYCLSGRVEAERGEKIAAGEVGLFDRTGATLDLLADCRALLVTMRRV